MKRTGTIIILLIVLTGAAMAQVCDICKQPITGRYTTYHRDDGDFTVCEHCRATNGKCALCGVPIPGTNPRAKNLLCAQCRKTARFCAICGDLIKGNYFITPSGKAVCARCRETAPKCDSCGTPLIPGEWSTDHGYKLCARCRKELKHCRGCGKPIIGQYMVYTGFDGFFCSDCNENSPKCISCGRPVGTHGHRMTNGNWICADCRPTAVLTRGQLTGLAREVRDHLKKYLLMDIDHAITWHLVDELPTSHGDDFREAGRFIRVNEDFTIKILKGLSREIAIETIAHELGHAWQAENFPGMNDALHQEGFAQWVAAQVVKDYHFDHLLPRFEIRDDVYGKGYLLMKRMEDTYGVAGMFRRLRSRYR